MKKLSLIFSLVFLGLTSYAQVGININGGYSWLSGSELKTDNFITYQIKPYYEFGKDRLKARAICGYTHTQVATSFSLPGSKTILSKQPYLYNYVELGLSGVYSISRFKIEQGLSFTSKNNQIYLASFEVNIIKNFGVGLIYNRSLSDIEEGYKLNRLCLSLFIRN
jgi:hypothetical protein